MTGGSLSAYTDSERQFLDEVCTGFLYKPFGSSELAAELNLGLDSLAFGLIDVFAMTDQQKLDNYMGITGSGKSATVAWTIEVAPDSGASVSV